MNLREFVDLLEEKGRLQRVTREVDQGRDLKEPRRNILVW